MSEPTTTLLLPGDPLGRLSGDGLLDQIAVAIIASDSQGRCVRMNAAAQALLGYTEQEVMGRAMHGILHDRHADGSAYPTEECPIQKARIEQRVLPLYDDLMWSKSREAVPVECSGSPIRLENGETGIVITLKDLRGARKAERRHEESMREQAEVLRQRDATARIERELAEAEAIRQRELSHRVEAAATAQLRSQQELLAAVVEVAPIGIAVLTGDLRIRWCNAAFQTSLDSTRNPAELADASMLDIARVGEDSRVAEVLQRVRDTGKPFLQDSFAIAREGRGLTFWWWSVTRLPSGELLSLNTDLTDQKRAQDALVQSDKMAAVGRLAASISHEINNPLEAVTNLLYLVDQDKQLAPESREYVKLAESELARVSQIASQTLRFHRHALGPVAVQPRQLIDPVIALYQGRLRHSKIEIRIDVRPIGTVTCYENDVRQILNNLFGNAIDAMPKGGTIHVRSRAAWCPRTGRPGLRVSVADSGHGMSAQTAAHIFEPFYTTKGASGSGLGLWISHTLAQRNGGVLQVRSCQHQPGSDRRSGTIFSLFLPDLAKVPEAYQVSAAA